MDVTFLINALTRGGAEKVLLRLSQKFVPKKIILLEKEVHYFTRFPLVALSSHTTQTPLWQRFLALPFYTLKLLSHLDSSCCISFIERANFVNVLAKQLRRHKVIVSVRADPKGYQGTRRINQVLIQLLYPLADCVVAVSQGVKQNLIRLGVPRQKIRVIYNPYSISRIQEQSKAPLPSYLLGSRYLITVGRLTKQKGHWHLLRIFRRLKERFSNIKLCLLGEGELKEDLVQLSQSLSLKTFVSEEGREPTSDYDIYFLGFQSNPFPYLANAELFLLPSLWEGFPNALVEALALGVPVVASDCPSGPREILAPDTPVNYRTETVEFAPYGVLMPLLEGEWKEAKATLTKGESLWLDGLVDLLENRPSLLAHYRKKGVERVFDFDEAVILKQWESLLREFM